MSQETNQKQWGKYLFKIAYFGQELHGFETHPNSKLPTVEWFLFKALRRVGLLNKEQDMKELEYAKCGWTDKGVSASGNYFSIKLCISQKEEYGLINWINSTLPNSIVIISYCRVADDFDAWRSALSRTYYYHFFNEGLDIEKMNSACKLFVGKHNFINFCQYTKEYDKSGTTKIIYDCKIEETDDFRISVFIVRANSFLWHQIRYMFAALLQIGSSKIDNSILEDMIYNNKQYQVQYAMADPNNLTLFDCEYEKIILEKLDENQSSYQQQFLGFNYQQIQMDINMVNQQHNYINKKIKKEDLKLSFKTKPK